MPCYSRAGEAGPILQAGTILSIVACVHEGSPETFIAEDGWNAFAADGKRAVQFSQMIVVTNQEPEVLTASRGGSLPRD